MSVKQPEKDKHRLTVNAGMFFVRHSVSALLQAREHKKFSCLPYDNRSAKEVLGKNKVPFESYVCSLLN
jgi:hypothetical protein